MEKLKNSEILAQLCAKAQKAGSHDICRKLYEMKLKEQNAEAFELLDDEKKAQRFYHIAADAVYLESVAGKAFAKKALAN